MPASKKTTDTDRKIGALIRKHRLAIPELSLGSVRAEVSFNGPLALSGGVPFSSGFNFFQPRRVLGQLLPGPRYLKNDVSLFNGARQLR